MRLPEIRKIRGDLGVIHFIGIGGIGISALAGVMHNLGYTVQGSDQVSNYNVTRLRDLGIKIYEGHSSDNLKGVEYVVISSAIRDTNPEVQGAIANKIPLIRRAEMLAEIMKLKTSIAISGSHGKTTTTSLIGTMFDSAGLNPTVITGGIINHKATNAYLGNGDYLIAEADESDATFIHIPSSIAVITNIDHEHLDFYKNFDNLFNAFINFINNIPFYGFAVVCLDNDMARKVVRSVKNRKVITYGITAEDANVKATNIKHGANHSTYNAHIDLPGNRGAFSINDVYLPMLGQHNILNSLAALAIAAELDFGTKTMIHGFKNFKGVKRRFSDIGRFRGARVIDDYAHHPKEIAVTLEVARGLAGKGKLIVVCQPHRYTRLQMLFEDFVSSFDLADIVFITPVYTAGELPITGINQQTLVSKLIERAKVTTAASVDNLESLAVSLQNDVAAEDIIIFLGAGDITKWAYNIAKQ